MKMTYKRWMRIHRREHDVLGAILFFCALALLLYYYVR